MQWLSGISRADVAVDTSLLQKPVPELTVEDLRAEHSTLRYVRATASAGIRISKVDLTRAVLVPYTDASWANAPGACSQAGMLLMLGDKDCYDGEVVGSTPMERTLTSVHRWTPKATL